MSELYAPAAGDEALAKKVKFPDGTHAFVRRVGGDEIFEMISMDEITDKAERSRRFWCWLLSDGDGNRIHAELTDEARLELRLWRPAKVMQLIGEGIAFNELESEQPGFQTPS